jgi:putative membrane protein
MYHDMDGWWMIWGGLMMLLFWGGLVALVVWVVRSLTGQDHGGRETPLEIARRRYAAGEITPQEYERLTQDLTRPLAGSGPPGRKRRVCHPAPAGLKACSYGLPPAPPRQA